MMTEHQLNSRLRDACNERDLAKVTDLVSRGASASAANGDGRNALHYVALSNGDDSETASAEIATLLLDLDSAIVNSPDDWGRVPLRYSSGHSNVPFSRVLLDRGGNPNFQDSSGWSAIHNACYYGHLELVLLLIRYGGNVHLKSYLGQTPLDLCDRARKDVAFITSYFIYNIIITIYSKK
jgi:ankyrin repeat protein